VAATVSSLRERPIPATGDSPIASTRIGSPIPGTCPWCGGFAGGRRGTRLRVALPWAHATGSRAIEPRRQAASAVGDPAPPEDAIERSGLTLEGSIARRADLPSSSLAPWRIPDTWRILARSDIYKRGPSVVSEDQIGVLGREGGDTRQFKKRRAGNKVPNAERPLTSPVG
jgi:hypothetical protein